MLMLAKKYNNQNPEGWMMSEKLDGVRVIWNGNILKSRNGNTFNAPSWFTKDLPMGTMLDGELWEGRGLFQKTAGKVRAHNGDWSSIKFMIFDSPIEGSFTDRFCRVSGLNLPSHCEIVEHIVCNSKTHLDCFEKSILEKNGEGVMLRDPNSEYEDKRSNSLLKVKRFDCSEAIITGHTKGEGKNKGQLGALICNWMGKVFKIGAGIPDAARRNPPAIGDTVTFSFFEKTDEGVPRFPSFVEVRDYE